MYTKRDWVTPSKFYLNFCNIAKKKKKKKWWNTVSKWLNEFFDIIFIEKCSVVIEFIKYKQTNIRFYTLDIDYNLLKHIQSMFLSWPLTHNH